jgi:RNA polymerase sigma-70 factor (ECF subfamily)
MELSDEQLISRVQQNDLNAFDSIVDRYKKKVYWIAFYMVGNHSDADDVTQETFIRAYRGLKRFKGRARFFTWLYRILMNCCTDYLRKRRRRSEYEYREDFQDEGAAETVRAGKRSMDALKIMERRELNDAVENALNALPVKQRAVLVLYEFMGMHHDEIARLLGCSAGTVRSRLFTIGFYRRRVG